MPLSPHQHVDKGSAYCTPFLESPGKTKSAKISSLRVPDPQLSPSPSSQPSIVFPAKTSPSPSPTSLKRRALAIPMGCQCSSLEDEEAPFDPEQPNGRCLSLGMLKHRRRKDSSIPLSTTAVPEMACPESHRPAPSSRSSSPVETSRPPSSIEMARSATSDPFPPVLTLPNEGAMTMGSGWADEFGIMIDTSIPPPRPWSTTFSQSPNQTSWPERPRSPSSHSVRDSPPPSTGFFSSNGISSTMPSPMSVLHAIEWPQAAPLSSVVEPYLFQDNLTAPHDESDAPSVHFQELRDISSPPPRLGFQLRRSAEDWATAVLRAVGTSVDS
ncbi:hypothetical protein JB92DRAFT_2969323 [Gautieria morchelliformis]|nr:hypothetical protein JB92DRAFT_2969323 [Gautieria morchelliformis]